jgi:arsenate reductase (glutaredoxin)
MAKGVTIYHNPRCSKSRQTLQLLRGQGVEPEIIEYLDDPPSQKRLSELIDLLGIEAHDLLRTKEKEYKGAGLAKDSSKAAIVKAIATHPILMERPVVVVGKKAALGRPPENVLRIL